MSGEQQKPDPFKRLGPPTIWRTIVTLAALAGLGYSAVNAFIDLYRDRLVMIAGISIFMDGAAISALLLLPPLEFRERVMRGRVLHSMELAAKDAMGRFPEMMNAVLTDLKNRGLVHPSVEPVSFEWGEDGFKPSSPTDKTKMN